MPITVMIKPIRSRQGKMRVSLTQSQWSRLNMDDATNRDVVRACFYIGLGLEETADIARSSPGDSRRDSVLRTAEWLGMNDDDIVELYT